MKNNLKKFIIAAFGIAILGVSTYFHFLNSNILQLEALGIPKSIIHIFLSVPLISCFISFTRHFLGININSFYFPIFLSISLFCFGFITTSVLLFIALILVASSRWVLKNYHLHNSTKNSLTVTFTSIIFLFILPLLLKVDIFSTQEFLSFIPILLILIILIDKFTNIQVKFNFKKDVIFAVRNLIFASISVILVGGNINIGNIQIQINSLREIIMNYPDLTLLLSVIATLLIGQYTGLRLDEIIRFRALLRKSHK